jgi:molybdopterin/thiamine biosynthesis adenylyltransferase
MSNRYARHALIPGWDQERLAAARVVILGIGALGSETARLLAQAGASALILCDGDYVEESNLSRGALFSPDDIGHPKVAAAARALAMLCPDTVVTQRQEWLVSGVGLAELRDATLVVSCLDTRGARVQLARRCGLAGVAMLDGGTRPWGGEIRLYPAGGPCYGCGLTVSERVQLDDRLSCTRPDETGASGAVSALIASWLAATALRIIFGQPVRAGILRVDAGNGDTHRIRQPRDPGCPLHERIPAHLVERSPLTWDATASELVARLRQGEAALGWTEFADPAQPFGIWLSNAPKAARLRDLGVAPREIIRIIARPNGRDDRFIELAGEPAGGGR